MAFDVLRKKKAVEIALTLFIGTKCVREIRDAVGGSFTTIGKRIEELIKANIIEEVYPKGIEEYKRHLPRRVIRLAGEGRKLVGSLIQSGFLSVPLLQKYRQKWILLVLRVLNVVRGRTRLIKLLFLLKFEFGLKKGMSFKFRPWIYGPYSKDIVQDLEVLQKDGLVYERPESYKKSEFKEEKICYIYTLTPKGAKSAQGFLEEVSPSILQKIENLRPFNEMALGKFLEYIYYNYQEFITSSVIVERVLDSFYA